MSGELLHACTSCGRGRLLLARIEAETLLCPWCWRAQGEPSVRSRLHPLAVHAAELAVRDQMLARGGADRYRVRAGKS